ncbi:MAG: LysR family transcriptional regulator [Rhodobacter sp.]|nr:LysR family transcriptional regulator [Rhodobacter sp.]
MSVRNLDLNLLSVFHAIYESRSISGAAKLLDLSQPGVSHSLKRLRAQLGDKLFVRKGNGVEPTVYAESIAGPIRAALLLLETGLGPSAEFDPGTSARHFRLMMADFVEPIILPDLLRLTDGNPDVTFELVSPQTMLTEEAILSGSVDLVVYLQSDMMHEISVEPLFPTDIVLAMRKGHPLLGDSDPVLAFARYKRIVPNLRAGAVKNFDKAKVAQQTDRNYACLVHSLRSIPALLSTTNYVSTLPRLFAAEMAELYGLVTLPAPFPLLVQDHTMSWHRKNDGDKSLVWLRRTITETIARKQVRADQIFGAR